ncbi:S8 family peptidase [Leptothrix ochracea]|uniref:S8 family peptidase n=1 Tax=Leptothrix ochracea TaxID=735331 RepID=UPI0034E26352
MTQTPVAQSGVAAERGRVIVHMQSPSAHGRLTTLATTSGSGAAVAVQHAQALGVRLGLALKDGRTLGPDTQVIFAQGLSSEALAQRLRTDPAVAWAAPDQRRFLAVAPNDSLYGPGQPSPVTPTVGQWYLRAPTSAEPAGIDVETAWDMALPLLSSRPAVVVAVLDSGVRLDHPDFSGKLLSGYDFVDQDYGPTGNPLGTFITAGDNDGWDADPSDPGDWVTSADSLGSGVLSGCPVSDSSWHGTQTTGIVGAATNNGIGMASVGSSLQVLPVRVMGKCGGWDSDIIAGMRWAAGLSVPGVPQNTHPARVLNLSLGSAGACAASYQAVAAELNALGVMIVASAGNDSLAVNAPANCPGVLAVGALRQMGSKAGYSSLGPEVVVSAPGGNCVNATGTCLYPILSTTNGGKQTPGLNGYSDGDLAPALGTSFSAPQVAGTVGLMLSVNPALDSAQVAQILGQSARTFPASGDPTIVACTAPGTLAGQEQNECYCTISTCGGGMLDAGAAVQDALMRISHQPLARIGLLPSPLLVGQSVVLNGATSIAPVGATITSYRWQITDGQNRVQWLTAQATTTATPTLKILSAGAFSVSLTVTDSTGATHTASRSGDAQLTVVTGVLDRTRPTVRTGMALDGLDLLALMGVLLLFGIRRWRQPAS